ncbi:MAG: NADH-quinone oxidoreductase subunit M [Planctomycetota bacterium]
MLATLLQGAASSSGGGILSVLTFAPVIGMLVILFLPRSRTEAIKTVAACAAFVPLALSIWLWFAYDKASPGVLAENMSFVEQASWIPTLGIKYYVGVDGLSVPILFLSCLIFFFAVFSSWTIGKGVKGYFAMFLLLETGTNGCFVALDFFLFYVFWELMLLPMYFLIGIWGGPRREYAAIKFFLYTLLGSVLMLVALVALYMQCGTFDLMQLAAMARDPQSTLYAAGAPSVFGWKFLPWVFWFLFIGFAVKVPIVPLHTWLPDAHVEAPTPISVILAGILLKLGGYGMMRILFPIGSSVMQQPETILTIALIGTVSILYGAFVAMAQTDFKKLVAYSSVSHMGFVLLGFAALNHQGMTGAAAQMFNHGLSSAMLFLIVGVFYDRAHHRDLGRMGGLASTMPKYAGLAMIGIFTSIGLPGLAGFVSEFWVLLGAFSSDAHGSLRLLAILSALGIVLTAGYLLWTIQRVFLGKPKDPAYEQYPDIDARETVTQAPFAVLCVLFGVLPFLLLSQYGASVQGLLDLLGR